MFLFEFGLFAKTRFQREFHNHLLFCNIECLVAKNKGVYSICKCNVHMAVCQQRLLDNLVPVLRLLCYTSGKEPKGVVTTAERVIKLSDTSSQLTLAETSEAWPTLTNHDPRSCDQTTQTFSSLKITLVRLLFDLDLHKLFTF